MQYQEKATSCEVPTPQTSTATFRLEQIEDRPNDIQPTRTSCPTWPTRQACRGLLVARALGATTLNTAAAATFDPASD